MPPTTPTYWPSARHFAEAVQCPAVCFTHPALRETLAAVDRLGMPLVTSGQFAYVFKLKAGNGQPAFAVRCFRSHLSDRAQRYQVIDAHLRAHAIPALPTFTYDANGILVSGKRYPLLVMQWIDGPTLDVYLDEMMGRRDVLLHLADEWVRLIGTLRDAGVAHGDLQHGNIIVEGARLRLVDLDGMFVPAMAGWASSEVGHQHFQHPARDAQFFNRGLDNFSALVIYVSLLALAERPALWTEHHDENIIFTKSDFLDPSASALFTKIKDMGGEPGKFAEILVTATQNDPAATPSLVDLVTPKSKLPSWMIAPPDIAVAGRTREAFQVVEPPSRTRDKNNTSAARRPRPPVVPPATPASAQVQGLFNAPAAPSTLAGQTPFAGSIKPDQLFAATFHFTKMNARKAAVLSWWLWVIIGQAFFRIFGFTWFILFIVLFAAGCLVTGFFRALSLLEDGSTLAGNQLPPLQAFSTIHTGLTRIVVASRTQGIYHLATCDYAGNIAPRNIIQFPTPRAAQSAGYRQCKVCSP